MISISSVMLSSVIALVVLPVFSSGSGSALADRIKLPEPKHDGNVSIEKALFDRRSIRAFGDEPLAIEDISQLLWAAQGITDPSGYRAAPSAGALYPLEAYLVAGKVTALPSGIYKYNPRGHELIRVMGGDKRMELCNAALGQTSIKHAPASLVLAAVYERTTKKYGDRGIRYAHMEAGHAAENVCLQGVSLGLGTVVIGAFYDDDVKKVMQLAGQEEPLYIIPFGRRSR